MCVCICSQFQLYRYTYSLSLTRPQPRHLRDSINCIRITHEPSRVRVDSCAVTNRCCGRRGGVADVSRGSCAGLLQGAVAKGCRRSRSQACARVRVYSCAVTDRCRGRVAEVVAGGCGTTLSRDGVACAHVRRRARACVKVAARTRARAQARVSACSQVVARVLERARACAGTHARA